ncbi:hypothetical protein, partial [uncultured Jannaschia sp.]|uniref:hypothetical protein n=1 Tax=uncultured Jannaschia sp. TaxID=293347 RepID=UPI002634CBD0
PPQKDESHRLPHGNPHDSSFGRKALVLDAIAAINRLTMHSGILIKEYHRVIIRRITRRLYHSMARFCLRLEDQSRKPLPSSA